MAHYIAAFFAFFGFGSPVVTTLGIADIVYTDVELDVIEKAHERHMRRCERQESQTRHKARNRAEFRASQARRRQHVAQSDDKDHTVLKKDGNKLGRRARLDTIAASWAHQ